MFNSSSPFGQSSSSPFGSPSIFGQTNNANNNNPFAPKPFGTTSPFGAQTGGSIFGGTSTGVFGGTPSSSPLSSAPVFGASSSPAFGSSTPAFGASSSPAFGNSSSSFGNSSVPGQKPAFGGFGSGNMQSSPFGGSFQQSQPAFGSNLFGSSTPFSAPSQPAFGASSTPAFGATTTPAFGGTSTPAFGATITPAFGGTSTPAFGATNTPAFGGTSTPAFAASSTPAFGGSASTPFGSTASAFGISGSPVFGSTPAFGASSASMFGSSSTPTYGTSSTPAFGTSSTPAFGASSIPSFGFGSTPSFGQSAPTFHGSSPFGTTTSPFGTQSSPFGTQATTPTFGSSGFGQPAPGGQRGGSRIASYTPATEVDSGTQPAGKLDSISAMPVYKDKSHEELRWEDYQQGDKGGAAPGGQAPGAIGFGVSNTQSNAFAASSTFGQTSANPFSSSTSSNLFAPKAAAFGSSGFGSSSTPAFGSSPFGLSSTSNLFGQTSSAAPSIFGSTPAFGAGTSPSIFGSSSASGFGTSTSIFGSAAVQGSTPAFGSALSFGNTQSATQFQSNAPSLGQTNSPFGQSAPFGQSGLFNTPATGFGGNLFASTPSLPSNTVGFGQTTPTLSTPFQSAQPAQTTSAFGFSNFGQTQPFAGTNNFGSTSSMFGQSLFGQSSATQNSVPVQQASFTNPFGTLPAMPQMSIGQGVASSSIQYGISSLPVIDKPAPVKISSLLTSRHLSQRRIRLPARKYHPKSDGPKVPFFINDDETISTPKADALFIPRENPRSLVIRPLEQWQTRVNVEKASHLIDAHENGKVAKTASTPNGSAMVNEDKNPVGNDLVKEQVLSVDANQKLNGLHYEHPQKDSSITLIGHRASGAAISYEHGANIESLMPQLRHSDYYTEPQIQELAAKERANPGFCRHVKDFVIGRHGCGSIKFLGVTDVRGLDLESLVQFNSREVIVYMDETKKPPVGQGLNKPAEVTLLNIKCIDQKTGQHCTGGSRVEKYKGMLIKKTEEQGAEFVSYNPVEGEWKFKVNHFSKYRLGSDDDEGEEDNYRDVHVAPC